MRNRGADCQERSCQIDRYRLVPFLECKIVNGSPYPVDPGIRHDNIEAAKTRDQIINRITHLIFVGNISFQRDGIAPRCFDLPNNIFELACGTPQRSDGVTFCCKCHCCGTPYTRARSSHQSHFYRHDHSPLLNSRVTKGRVDGSVLFCL